MIETGQMLLDLTRLVKTSTEKHLGTRQHLKRHLARFESLPSKTIEDQISCKTCFFVDFWFSLWFSTYLASFLDLLLSRSSNRWIRKKKKKREKALVFISFIFGWKIKMERWVDSCNGLHSSVSWVAS